MSLGLSMLGGIDSVDRLNHSTDAVNKIKSDYKSADYKSDTFGAWLRRTLDPSYVQMQYNAEQADLAYQRSLAERDSRVESLYSQYSNLGMNPNVILGNGGGVSGMSASSSPIASVSASNGILGALSVVASAAFGFAGRAVSAHATSAASEAMNIARVASSEIYARSRRQGGVRYVDRNGEYSGGFERF